MTPDDIRRDTRIAELRQALMSVRRARAALAAGKLRDAVRHHAEAVRSVHFMLGLLRWTTATAGMSRIVWLLGCSIEDALPNEPPLGLPAAERLIEIIRDGITVLRTRDDIDVDDEHATERAKNIATAILGEAEAGRA